MEKCDAERSVEANAPQGARQTARVQMVMRPAVELCFSETRCKVIEEVLQLARACKSTVENLDAELGQRSTVRGGVFFGNFVLSFFLQLFNRLLHC